MANELAVMQVIEKLPVVSSSANARGAKHARRARRISWLLPRSSVVTTRYLRERTYRFYRWRLRTVNAGSITQPVPSPENRESRD